MPQFTKQISQPGKRLASTPGGNQRVWIDLTKERQQGWVDQFKAMKAKGLRVPAPFVHREDSAGRPLTEAELKKITSKDNAGWWEDFWLDQNDNLMGRLNVPNDEDAKKIGTTIVDVSPSVLPSHIDGMGNRWDKEALMHVALVTHPVDQNQPNFNPIINEEGAQMSNGFNLIPQGFQMDMDNPGGGGPVSQVPPQNPPAVVPTPSAPIVGNDFSAAVQILQKLGLALPPDTNPENLMERIVATGMQKLSDKEKAGGGDDEIGTPPPGASPQPSPVALSQQHKQLVNIATRSFQGGLTQRINALVADGKVSQTFADANFMPQVNGFQLSLDQAGQPLPCPLEMTLATLEAMPSPMRPITGFVPGADGAQFGLSPDGKFKVQEPPTQPGAKLEGKEVDDIAASQLSGAGLTPAGPWSQ